MTNRQIITKLKQLQKDRPNVGADLTLFGLINLLTAYFKDKEHGDPGLNQSPEKDKKDRKELNEALRRP